MEHKNLSKRQRNILAFIERFLDQRGYPPTIREIGEAVDIASTSVVNYNLNKLVDHGYIERVPEVSRGLRLVPQDDNGNVALPDTTPVDFDLSGAMFQIPLVGTIAASAPVTTPEDFGYYYDTDDMIDVPMNMLGVGDQSDLFALRVTGDSMIDAMVAEGDIIVLKRQNVAKNGDMVAVWLSERGETTLKHYFLEGKQVRLQPANPTMGAIFVDAKQVNIQGRVLAVLRTLH